MKQGEKLKNWRNQTLIPTELVTNNSHIPNYVPAFFEENGGLSLVL